jgi:hypothetical protein
MKQNQRAHGEQLRLPDGLSSNSDRDGLRSVSEPRPALTGQLAYNFFADVGWSLLARWFKTLRA